MLCVAVLFPLFGVALSNAQSFHPSLDDLCIPHTWRPHSCKKSENLMVCVTNCAFGPWRRIGVEVPHHKCRKGIFSGVQGLLQSVQNSGSRVWGEGGAVVAAVVVTVASNRCVFPANQLHERFLKF